MTSYNAVPQHPVCLLSFPGRAVQKPSRPTAPPHPVCHDPKSCFTISQEITLPDLRFFCREKASFAPQNISHCTGALSFPFKWCFRNYCMFRKSQKKNFCSTRISLLLCIYFFFCRKWNRVTQGPSETTWKCSCAPCKLISDPLERFLPLQVLRFFFQRGKKNVPDLNFGLQRVSFQIKNRRHWGELFTQRKNHFEQLTE